MAVYVKRARKRHRAERPKRQRGAVRGVTAMAPSAAEELKRPFDEPATPPQKANVSVQEPVAQPPAAEDEEACGLPDARSTPASDLH